MEQITWHTLYYFILKQLSCFPFFLISNHLSHLKQINSCGGYVLRAFIWSLLPGKLLLLSVCVLKLTDSIDCIVTSDDKRQQGPTSLHVVSEEKKKIKENNRGCYNTGQQPGQLFKREVCKIAWFIYVFSLCQIDKINIVQRVCWGGQCRAEHRSVQGSPLWGMISQAHAGHHRVQFKNDGVSYQ